MRAVLEGTVNETVSFTDYASGIWLPDTSKLTINKKNNDVIIWGHNVIVKHFWCYFVSLVKFSYWSKLHVNICRSLVWSYDNFLWLTRNLEIRNTSVWVSSNIWRLEQVSDTKVGMSFSNKMYWMLQNTTVIAFTVSELLRENQQGVAGKITPHPD